MELTLNEQKNQEIENSNNIQNQNNLEKNKDVELLVEQEVTVENQDKFLQTTLGKTINTAIDIGLRGILPDMVEEQIIDIKNVLLTNRTKRGDRYSNKICNRFWKKCTRNCYRKI